MSFLTQAEKHLHRLQYRALKQLLNRGMGKLDVRVYDGAKDVHQQAYGSASGSRTSNHRVIQAILTGEDFFVMDALRGGSFSQGWMWVEDPNLVGDGKEISVVSEDGRDRRYRIEFAESVGWSTRIFTRYKLAAEDRP